ncbi:hypothetical protein M885DRAFT_501347 [Pelagophyceae sp. CCMP2097]|nr:hypothetical protein M885DRAFT_501347 [Pelagophyceae sp. CCMP2097]
MHDRKHDEFIMRCITNLREMPTTAAFECLREITLAVWKSIGEGDFADYFRRIYLTDPWQDWYLGALPLGGTSDQQSIEGGNRADKKVLGPMALRAAPATFFAESISVIFGRMELTLQDLPAKNLTVEGRAPVRALHVYEAQMYNKAARGVPHRRLEDGNDGNQYFAPMGALRAKTYSALYDEGRLPKLKKGEVLDQEYYETLERDVLCTVVVQVVPVADPSELRHWAQFYGELYTVGPDPGAQLADLRCSCEKFAHSYNHCVHVLALAIVLGLVDPADLIDGAQPRRGPGRPPNDPGALKVSSGAAKKHTAASFLTQIRREGSKTLRYHGFYVVAAHGDEYVVGYVRCATTATPPKHRITLLETASDGATFLDWDDASLAAGLALALEQGKTGVYSRPPPSG